MRRRKYSLEEVHLYTADLASLQLQRTQALALGESEEAANYTNLIEHASLVLERLLENV